jgi:hypothetical protein
MEPPTQESQTFRVDMSCAEAGLLGGGCRQQVGGGRSGFLAQSTQPSSSLCPCSLAVLKKFPHAGNFSGSGRRPAARAELYSCTSTAAGRLSNQNRACTAVGWDRSLGLTTVSGGSNKFNKVWGCTTHFYEYCREVVRVDRPHLWRVMILWDLPMHGPASYFINTTFACVVCV